MSLTGRWSYDCKTMAGTMLVATMAALTAWSIYIGRDRARRDAEQVEWNITATLERAIEHAATTLDLSLRGVVQGMSIPGIEDLPPDVRNAVLFDGPLSAHGVRGIRVVDEHGDTVYTMRRDMLEGVNFADRKHFQAQLASPDDKLIVTGPVRSRSDGTWLLVFSRRLSHADGSFAGVVMGGIELSVFDSLFNSLDLDPDAVVALITTEGISVARRPSLGADVGQQVRDGAIFTHLSPGPTGAFVAHTRVDGERRLFTYRRVGDLPLVVAMGMTTHRVYAAWRQRAQMTAGAMILLSAILFLMARAWRSEFRQRAAAERAALMAQAEAEHLAAALSQSLARREALVATTPDCMIVVKVHDDGRCTYEDVNPVWQHMTGLSAAEAIGQEPQACFPPPVCDVVANGWAECLRTRHPVSFSIAMCRNGEEQFWDAVVCPVLEPDGAIHRIIGTARNVTDHLRLEGKLRETHRMEAVGQLASGVAHDFNNLLQSMLGALEIASEAPLLDTDHREALGIAMQAGHRGAGLVHQLLAFSRKQLLAPALLEPERIMTQLLPLLRSAVGSRHRLVTEVQPGAGRVLADELQLNRCLMDMVLNARDAMPRGGTLRLHVCRAEWGQAEAGIGETGEHVRFVIEDEGTGIAPESLARVFEPFFTTKEVGRGNGLGLSMVQGFARQSGGDATIESAVGVGTVVSLWLPRIDAAPGPVQTAAPGRACKGSGCRRVLLVDDEPSVRQTISLFLSKAGYAAVSAESGEQALALIGSDDPFDLVITDQSMPGITGTELLEEVSRQHPSMPAMLITGFDRVSGMERVAARVVILTKPFQRTVFLRQVAALIDEPAPALTPPPPELVG